MTRRLVIEPEAEAELEEAAIRYEEAVAGLGHDFLAEMRSRTGDYLGATDPDALVRLSDLADEYPAQLEVRVYEAPARSFDPKSSGA